MMLSSWRGKEKPAVLDWARLKGLRAASLAVLTFIYVPLLVLVAFSFNDSRRAVVWRGFSLKWYEAALQDYELGLALASSLVIAVTATAISLFLGTLVAVTCWRFRFSGRGVIMGLMIIPLAIPEMCLGISLLILFHHLPLPSGWPWPFNLATVTLAHSSFCFPFVVIVVRARLYSCDRRLADAAQDLGAWGLRVFRDAYWPHLRPSILAGGLLSFMLSLDDFIVTFFTSTPEVITLPMKIYGMVRFSVSPQIHAASSLLIGMTFLCAVGVALIWRRRDHVPAMPGA